MRGLLLAAIVALAWPATAHARPRVLKFACHFGDGRTHLLARRVEAGSDDALYCWVQLGGVRERQVSRLAGELLVVKGGRKRALTLGSFEPRLDRYQQAAIELAVAHDDWFPSVNWSGGRRPRLHLLVQVYDRRDSPLRRRWQRVLVASGQVGHHRVRAGTPSFKNDLAPPTLFPRHWSGFASRGGTAPTSNPYDDNP